jgi:hypothetical protein
MEIELSEAEARYLLGKLVEEQEYYGLLVRSSKCSVRNWEGYERVSEVVGKLEEGIAEEQKRKEGERERDEQEEREYRARQ